MADASDVERALVSTIASAIYAGSYLPGAYAASKVAAAQPATTANPTPSAEPLTVKTYRGWPVSKEIDADLAAGNSHISVFVEHGMTRNTSRYPHDPLEVTPTVEPTITATVAGATVTIGGTITAGNVVGVAFGPSQVKAAYAYAVQSTDTLATVAAALAALSGGTAAGPVLTLPSALGAQALTMMPQSAWTELRRQDQGFRISIWAPFPAARDALASAVDVGFAGLQNTAGQFTRFMPLPDGSTGWIRYRATYTDDLPSRDRVWRRDLCYLVEYPTTLIQQQPQMLFGADIFELVEDNVLFGTGAFQPPASIQADQNGDLLADAAGTLIGVPPT